MSDPDRPTAEAAYLVNAHITQPALGSKVFALQHGGSLVPAVWTSTSLRDFDAWMVYPKIPQDVRAIQEARFRFQEELK